MSQNSPANCPWQQGHEQPLLFSIAQVAAFWTAQGGASDATVKMAAVAWAESSLDANAVSVDCCLGLWQICAGHAQDRGQSPAVLFDPDVNANYAIDISSNGARLAAWDTCYPSIEYILQNGRTPIDYPMQGSPAYNLIADVQAALGGTSGGGSDVPASPPTPAPPGQAPYPPVSVPSAPVPAPTLDNLTAAWQQMSDFAGHGAVQADSFLNQVSDAYRKLMGVS
ncbi:MAG: transglycosylase SLT domain-containing protein [Streptosporangiaceae bacterium]